MASFFLAEIEVFDAEMYRTYTELASQVVQQYGGVYIFRSDRITPVSGDWEPRRLVLVRFHSTRDIHRCFASEEYLAIKYLREQSTKSRAIIIEEE